MTKEQALKLPIGTKLRKISGRNGMVVVGAITKVAKVGAWPPANKDCLWVEGYDGGSYWTEQYENYIIEGKLSKVLYE